MRQLIEMRGIPGAGKDHVAKTLASLAAAQGTETLVFSANDYFTKHLYGSGKEVWHFDPAKLSEAHTSCFRRALTAMQEGTIQRNPPLIVISNTNIHAWECAPYMMAAEAYGWEAKIVTVTCPPDIAFRRGLHGVPRHKVARMAAEMDRAESAFPKHLWKMETYDNG